MRKNSLQVNKGQLIEILLCTPMRGFIPASNTEAILGKDYLRFQNIYINPVAGRYVFRLVPRPSLNYCRSIIQPLGTKLECNPSQKGSLS